MLKELKVKCNCNSLMEFDYYANKFICPNCGKRLTLNEIKDRGVIESDSKVINKIDVKYQKDYFLEEIKKKLKKCILVPKEFKKLKKLQENDINNVEVYVIRYNGIIVLDNNIYEIKDLVFDNSNLDSNIINLLYPIDFNNKYEVINKNLDNFNEIEESIHKEVEKIVEGPDNKIIYLKEEYDIYLECIYDYQINYNNKNYHIAMNTYNSKTYIEVPISKYKFLVITSFFLIIDILYFIFIRLMDSDKEFSTLITIIMFIIELLVLIILYNSSRVTYQEEKSKNKAIISKKSINK